MKILFNTYYHAFQNPGGGEIVLKKTREALLRRGLTVDLFDQWKTKISDYDILHNFSVVNYRDFDGLKSYAGKLVVTPVMWPDISSSSVIKEQMRQWKNTLLGHQSSEVNFLSALQTVDKFFPTTTMEWERIQKRYNLSTPHRVVYNGVDMPQSAAGTFGQKFGVKNYVLYVGRISPLKNVSSIIEAALLAGKKMVIVGKADLLDHGYEKKLREDYSSNSNVIFTGPLENGSQILSDAFYEADCLVVASAFETCSLTGLEAGIRGTPVLMTERGATREVYQDYVHYIDPVNIPDIAQKLSLPFPEEKKAKLKHFIQERYNWDAIASHLAEEYAGLLK